MEYLLFFPIFTKGIKAKLNELESESDIFPQNEGKVGKSEMTPVVKALTNCALDLLSPALLFFSQRTKFLESIPSLSAQ